jgi:hypothetical protein
MGSRIQSRNKVNVCIWMFFSFCPGWRRVTVDIAFASGTGLPDGFFLNQKSQIWVNFGEPEIG